jgi:hypothetical protein
MSQDASLDPNHAGAEAARQEHEREQAATVRLLDCCDYVEYNRRLSELRTHGLATAFRNAVEREKLRQEFGV